MMKRLMVWLLILSMSMPCLAEDQAMQITVRGQILQSADVSEAGLDVLNRVLSRLTLREEVSEKRERAALLIDGREMWNAVWAEEENAVSVTFSDTTCYVTGKDQPDALMLLTGRAVKSTRKYFAPDAILSAIPETAEMLGSIKEAVAAEYAVTVDYAAYSPRYDRYMLPAESLNAAWPQVAAAVWRHMFPDGGDQEAYAALCDVQFTGENVQVRRLYDKQGADLGIQLLGSGRVMGEERKISLLYGYTPDKGGSITLSAKALKGKNTLRLKAFLKEKRNEQGKSTSFSVDFLHHLNGEENAWVLEGTTAEQAETFTADITLEKGTYALLVQADFANRNNLWSGTLLLTEKEKKKVTLQALLTIDQEPYKTENTPEEVQEISLMHLTEEEARAVLLPENVVLLRALMYLMDDLTPEERWQLTHDLKNERWLNGPDMPVPEFGGEYWLVEEEEP